MIRRDVLKCLALIAMPVAGRAHASQPNRNGPSWKGSQVVYLDQSGVLGSGSGAFTLGVLAIRNPETFETAIQALRKQTRFRCRLRYRSRNRWKIPMIKALFDYCLVSGESRIAIRAIADSRKDKEPRAERDERLVRHYAQLLAGLPGSPRALEVVTQRRYPEKKNSEVFELLRKRQPRITKITFVKEEDVVPIQFLGTLVGSIQMAEHWKLGVTKTTLVRDLGKRAGGKGGFPSNTRTPALSIETRPRG